MAYTNIKSLLKSGADTVGKKKNGNIIARREFFYRHGGTAESFAEKISSMLTEAGVNYIIVDKGEHWTAFRGGASVANQSHWWVEIAIEGGRLNESNYR